MHENKLIDVFAEQYETLTKYAIMIVKEKEGALDAMQNVALVIATKAYEIKEIKKPTAFLITCVRRAALNFLRDKAKVYPTDPAIFEETHSDEYSSTAMEYLEWVMVLNKYLESYSQQLQDAFILHYVDGHPLDTVAGKLNMTSNALAQQFRRMRKKIVQRSPEYKVLLIFLSYL